MMDTPFYKVRRSASSSGWRLRFEGYSGWLPIMAWANAEVYTDSDTVKIIIPCVAGQDGCIEPTDMAAEIRKVRHKQQLLHTTENDQSEVRRVKGFRYTMWECQ